MTTANGATLGGTTSASTWSTGPPSVAFTVSSVFVTSSEWSSPADATPVHTNHAAAANPLTASVRSSSDPPRRTA